MRRMEIFTLLRGRVPILHMKELQLGNCPVFLCINILYFHFGHDHGKKIITSVVLSRKKASVRQA